MKTNTCEICGKPIDENSTICYECQCRYKLEDEEDNHEVRIQNKKRRQVRNEK